MITLGLLFRRIKNLFCPKYNRDKFRIVGDVGINNSANK